jgi:RHS repeat-associated protein
MIAAYDAAGNQTVVNGNMLSYDAENRQTAVAYSGTTENYLYDGDGKRVGKTATGLPTTVFVYDAQGRMAAEYSTGTESSPCNTCYLSQDHLGTARMITDQSGTVVARHDYLPFGEEIASGMAGRIGSTWGSSADSIKQKFTGKERDSESGLDYFGARYYGSALGRFTSPDPRSQVIIRQNSIAGGLPEEAANSFFQGFLENPQNWNEYAYVRNNPLAFTDPTGAAAVPGEGHHLLVLRNQIQNPIARAFADSVKTGGPNPPSNVWGEPHAEYNAAYEEMLSSEEQMLGSSDYWSLSQWKEFATKVLNSSNPAIKNFLDTIEREAPGARAKLAAAITAFRASAAVQAQAAAWATGVALSNFLSDFLFVVGNPSMVSPHIPTHSDCLLDRDTHTCVM